VESSSNENAKQVTSALGRAHPTPRFMSLGGLCVEASDSGCSMSSGNIKAGGDIYIGGNDIRDSGGTSRITFSGGNVIITLG